MIDIPGSFPCTTIPEQTDIFIQSTCIHHWVCDPPIESTSLCVCVKCYSSKRLKNRIYIPEERDGYIIGSVTGKPGSLDGFDLINGIEAEY